MLLASSTQPAGTHRFGRAQPLRTADMRPQRPLEEVWGRTSALTPTLIPIPLFWGHTYLRFWPRDEHWGRHLQTEPLKVPLTEDVLHRHPAEGVAG